MNLRQKLVVVTMDILLLAELLVCMYLGQQQGDNLTVFFLKTYLPAGALTVLPAWFLIRRLRDRADLSDGVDNSQASAL
jgi:hypothetical protein